MKPSTDRLSELETEFLDANCVEVLVALHKKLELERSLRSSLVQKRRAIELKLRVERRAGDILRSLKLRGGDKRKGVSRLKSLGVSQNQSTRWQLVASVADEVFQRYLIDCQRTDVMPRRSKLLELAKNDTQFNRAFEDSPLADEELLYEIRNLIDDCKLFEQLVTRGQSSVKMCFVQQKHAKRLISSMQNHLSAVVRELDKINSGINNRFG